MKIWVLKYREKWKMKHIRPFLSNPVGKGPGLGQFQEN